MGEFVVQYQETLNADETMRLRQFVRGLKHLPLPALFQIEVHEVLHEVRAVLRWPLYEDYFGIEDVKAAISILFDYWTLVESVIVELSANTNVDAAIERANERLASLTHHAASGASERSRAAV